MSQFSGCPQAAINYDSTIIGALELSDKNGLWRFNCLELAGIRGTCWTLLAAGWFPLSSV